MGTEELNEESPSTGEPNGRKKTVAPRGNKLPPVKWFKFEVPQKDVLPLVGMLIRLFISILIFIPAFILLFMGTGMREIGVTFVSIILTYWFGISKNPK